MRELTIMLPPRIKPYRQCSIKPEPRRHMDIQTILNAIQPAFIIIVIAAAMSAAGYFYQWGVQKLPANAQKILDGLAKTVVQAIEQKYADNNTGSTLKKQQAMN